MAGRSTADIVHISISAACPQLLLPIPLPVALRPRRSRRPKLVEWKPIRHAREALFEQLEQFMFDLVGGGIRRQLSPLMLSLERLLVGLAAAGDAIPPNGELGEMLGGKGRQSVDRALRGLVDAGRARLDLTHAAAARPGCSNASGIPNGDA